MTGHYSHVKGVRDLDVRVVPEKPYPDRENSMIRIFVSRDD